jgi:hypothetical protein
MGSGCNREVAALKRYLKYRYMYMYGGLPLDAQAMSTIRTIRQEVAALHTNHFTQVELYQIVLKEFMYMYLLNIS